MDNHKKKMSKHLPKKKRNFDFFNEIYIKIHFFFKIGFDWFVNCECLPDCLLFFFSMTKDFVIEIL